MYDTSNFEIEMSLWGDLFKNSSNQLGKNNIIALKGVRIGEYGQVRVISSTFSTRFYLNTNTVEAQILKNHILSQHALESDVKRFTKQIEHQPKTCKIVEEEGNNLLLIKKKDKIFSTILGTLTFVRNEGTMYYLACVNEKCQKKVTLNEETHKYFCNNCQLEIEKPKVRFITFIKINDNTGTLWCSINDNIGNQLFGKTAEEIKNLRE